MKEASWGLRAAVVVLILSTAPGAAMAYIDPGNGAYMVQALFTLVGAAIFYLRHPVRSLKVFWHAISSRLKGTGASSGDDVAPSAHIVGDSHDTDGALARSDEL
jgi:hypothetical protein